MNRDAYLTALVGEALALMSKFGQAQIESWRTGQVQRLDRRDIDRGNALAADVGIFRNHSMFPGLLALPSGAALAPRCLYCSKTMPECCSRRCEDGYGEARLRGL